MKDFNFFEVLEDLLQDVADKTVEKLNILLARHISPAKAIDHIECIHAAVNQEALLRGIVSKE